MKHALKLALRGFAKRKSLFFINTLGLGIAVFCSLLILTYSSFELSFDNFHEQEHVYRAELNVFSNSELIESTALGPPAMAPTVMEDLPEVNGFFRICPVGNATVTVGEEVTTINKFYLSDGSFFDVMSFELEEQMNDFLDVPYQIVLSKSVADQLFPDKSALGEEIEINSETAMGTFTVTGIYADPPTNSHMQPAGLVSNATLQELIGTSVDDIWRMNFFYTYLVTDGNSSPEELEKKINDVVTAKGSENLRPGTELEFFLTAMEDIHLSSEVQHQLEDSDTNASTITFLLILVVFILGTAWINYMNLSTAYSVDQLRQAAISKLVGADKRDMMRQYLFSTATIHVIALILGIVLAALVLPTFADIVNKPLSFRHLVGDGLLLPAFALVYLAGIPLSGFYPASLLTRVQPMDIVTGGKANTTPGLSVNFRKILVGVQFAFSLGILFFTVVLFNQLNYFLNYQTGLEIDNMLVVKGPINNLDASTYQVFKSEMEANSSVNHVISSTTIPGEEVVWKASLKFNNSKEEYTVSVMGVDFDYLETFGLELVAGRSFSVENANEENKVIINQRAAEILGITNPEDAINMRFSRVSFDSAFWDLQIIGVVEDFNHASLTQQIDPMIIRYLPVNSTYFVIDPAGEDMKGNWTPFISDVREKYASVFPGNRFEYFFLEDFYEDNYSDTTTSVKILSMFTIFSVLVIFMGIFGLSSYLMMSQRKNGKHGQYLYRSSGITVVVFVKIFQ
ncbi:MAG: ABC transporter permease, partial [Bacteroidota bacterium]